FAGPGTGTASTSARQQASVRMACPRLWRVGGTSAPRRRSGCGARSVLSRRGKMRARRSIWPGPGPARPWPVRAVRSGPARPREESRDDEIALAHMVGNLELQVHEGDIGGREDVRAVVAVAGRAARGAAAPRGDRTGGKAPLDGVFADELCGGSQV